MMGGITGPWPDSSAAGGIGAARLLYWSVVRTNRHFKDAARLLGRLGAGLRRWTRLPTRYPERRLAAIVSFDFVDFSRFVQHDEPRTLAALDAIFSHTIASLGRYRGKLFKMLGDGGLIEFESAVEATEWAVAFQHDLRRNGGTKLPAGRIEFRVGIAIGDVVVSRGDRLGECVALAVRVQEMAAPGSVALSDYVHQLVRGKSPTFFEDCGHRKLKNIAEPMRIWQWQPEEREPKFSALANVTEIHALKRAAGSSQ